MCSPFFMLSSIGYVLTARALVYLTSPDHQLPNVESFHNIHVNMHLRGACPHAPQNPSIYKHSLNIAISEKWINVIS
jgi:hypothetical protein